VTGIELSKNRTRTTMKQHDHTKNAPTTPKYHPLDILSFMSLFFIFFMSHISCTYGYISTK